MASKVGIVGVGLVIAAEIAQSLWLFGVGFTLVGLSLIFVSRSEIDFAQRSAFSWLPEDKLSNPGRVAAAQSGYRAFGVPTLAVGLIIFAKAAMQ